MVCVNTQGAPLHPAVQKSAGLDRIRYTASYSFETAIHHAVRLLLSTSIIGWIVSSLKVNWCLSARGQGGAEHGAVCEGPLCCSEGVTAADQSERREPRQRWHLRIRRILYSPLTFEPQLQAGQKRTLSSFRRCSATFHSTTPPISGRQPTTCSAASRLAPALLAGSTTHLRPAAHHHRHCDLVASQPSPPRTGLSNTLHST